MEAAYPKSRSPFLEQVRAAIRVRHYSVRTERAYIDWIVRFIHFHGRRHPAQMGETEVGAFLSHLVVERAISSVFSTVGSRSGRALAARLLPSVDIRRGALPRGSNSRTMRREVAPRILDEFGKHVERRNILTIFHTSTLVSAASFRADQGLRRTCALRDMRHVEPVPIDLPM
jgi:hypothetical protein